MNSLQKLFGTDPKKETEGVWVNYDDEVSFLIAAKGNKKAQEVGKKLIQPYKRADGEVRVPDNMQDDILAEISASAILLDWKGVKDDAGQPLPYSLSAAKAMLKNLPHFAQFVDKCAGNIELYRVQAEEAARKN